MKNVNDATRVEASKLPAGVSARVFAVPIGKAGSAEGYNYSEAMKGSGITWDEASFKEFIKNPKAKVPGTKMIFQGLTSEGDQDNVWAYLAQFKADGSK